MRWLSVCLLLAACSSAPAASPDALPDANVDGVSTTVAHTTASIASSTAVTTTTMPAADDVVVPVGFDSTMARVTGSDGTVCDICVWLADSTSKRALGLMNVTDLGGADAMAFVYPEAHTGSFWMKNTVMPLSIAFFAPDGGFLQAFDMEPCVADPCLSYATPPDFLIALEVPQGELPAFDIEPGSTFELLDLPCDET